MSHQSFASGKFAWGLCDYCALRYRLNTLRATVVMGKRTGFLACPDCWSPDHPQNHLSAALAAHGADPQALRQPRPDPNSDRVLSGDPDWLKKLQNGVA